MTWRGTCATIALMALAWPHAAAAQFTRKLCKPTSHALLISTAAGTIYPSAGIAEPVTVGQFNLICVRATQNGTTAVWQEAFGCEGAAVVSWRLGGRIRVNCVRPDTAQTNEETN